MTSNPERRAKSGIPAKISELETEVRVLREKLDDADKLIQTRIEAMDQRNDLVRSSIEETKQFVDGRAKIFNIGSAIGLVLAFLFLFGVIYTTARPIAEDFAKQAARGIDWNEKVETAANAELKKFVTPEALAHVFDAKAIQTAAADVVDSPEFAQLVDGVVQRYVSGSLLNDDEFTGQIRNAVSSTIDEKIASSESFQQTIEDQLEAERERVQKVLASAEKIEASTREELVQQLLQALANYEKLGEGVTVIYFRPFVDAMRIRTEIYWRPDEPKGSRFKLTGITVQYVNATTKERKAAIVKYLGHDVPNVISLQPASESIGPRFVAGYMLYEPLNSDTFESVTATVVDSVVTFVEECFQLQYPVQWHVTGGAI